VCIDASYTPGLFTCPLMQNSFGPLFFSGPIATNHSAPFTRISGHVGERLDIVDDRRAAVETDDGRERRPQARLGALALERLQERRLLARLVGAGAAVHVDLAVVPAAQDVRAQEPPGAGLGDRGLEHGGDVLELAADVDVADLRADGITRDRHALDDEVRVPLQQHVILEGAGLALVRVAAHVLRPARIFRHEPPLHARRKAGAAAAPQAGRLDEVDDLPGLHRERRAQPRVGPVPQRHVEREAVRLANERCQYWFEHRVIDSGQYWLLSPDYRSSPRTNGTR
jgi:hypothetical protein